MSSKESSEQASLTAPLKSPSSSSRETLVARYSMGSWEGDFPTLRRGAVAADVIVWTSAFSLSCLLIAEANDLLLPPLRGVRRHRELNRRRRSHTAWSFVSTHASRMVASFFPQCSLEALGILLIIFTMEPVGGISGALAGREGSSQDGVGPAEIAGAGGAPTTIVEGVGRIHSRANTAVAKRAVNSYQPSLRHWHQTTA